MACIRLVILFIAVLVVSTLAKSTWKIWGGEEASKNDYPYVASVRENAAHVCGGTIIGTRSILTAAHCVVKNGKIVSLDSLTTRVGSTNQFSGGKLYYVAEISVHPNFAGEEHDVAILILESPLMWTDRVAMIEIAKFSTDEPTVGDLVLVAGWGEQSSNESSHKLHSMLFSIATQEACLNAFSKRDDSHICLAHDLRKGSCFGDAGNGAVYKNKLIGVSSFIIGACGSHYPDVFSSIAYHSSWIETILI